MLTRRQPLRVAVLCSRRAPGLVHLLRHDTNRGRLYDVAGVLTSEEGFAEEREVAAHGVAVVHHPIASFHAARGASLYRDRGARREYDDETRARLDRWHPDLVLLDGYLFVLTAPMLDAYGGRMLNLHFSDLSIRRPDGRPLYAGIRAVRDALRAGETDTCATVHVVTEEPDGGPQLVRSEPFPVSPLVGRAREWGADDMLKAYAFAHQEWMMQAASGPLLAAAVALVASAQVDLEKLARRDPATVVPWLVDAQGRLTPPSALHICERLWGYQRAEART